MATINPGTMKFATPGDANASFSDSSRRLFDFSDRVADLSPEESPFFVYLSKVAKVPTSDPQFRFLEDRTKVSWSDRSFLIKDIAGSTAVTAVADIGGTSTFCVDTVGGASVDWLVKGMVFAIDFKDGGNVPETVLVRIETAPTDRGTDTTFQGRTISNKDGTAEDVPNNTVCQVVGTAFEEGSGSPDVWSEDLDNDYGYTQIFKTAAEMSNTARATVYRGYADEWARIWNLKLREHKVDIERAMLFGQLASQNGIQYSEGVVGHIIKNGTAVTGTSDWSYSAGNPYFRSVTEANLTYDRLLSDFEVMYDPARGGSSNKLALAGFKVITYFNKLAGFSKGNVDLGPAAAGFNYDIQNIKGSFGHSLMKIDTVYGSMSLVKEPLFRGMSTGYMALVDLDNVAYRPLVGNGVNRDTSITTNVQQADEDLRKDMILTEAGLEITLPETHALYSIES